MTSQPSGAARSAATVSFGRPWKKSASLLPADFRGAGTVASAANSPGHFFVLEGVHHPLISVHAWTHSSYVLHSLPRSSPQSLIGVFQNAIWS